MGRDWEETGGRRVGMGIVEREREGGRRRERWDDCTYFGGCVQSTGHISQVSVVVHDLSSSSKTQHRTITYVRPTTCMSYRHCQFAFQPTSHTEQCECHYTGEYTYIPSE